ncbi:hypothetical protein N9L06_06410 [Mariniblastus sp.]|nr:hypothetical protein [Mariniblastus sp.]
MSFSSPTVIANARVNGHLAQQDKTAYPTIENGKVTITIPSDAKNDHPEVAIELIDLESAKALAHYLDKLIATEQQE